MPLYHFVAHSCFACISKGLGSIANFSSSYSTYFDSFLSLLTRLSDLLLSFAYDHSRWLQPTSSIVQRCFSAFGKKNSAVYVAIQEWMMNVFQRHQSVAHAETDRFYWSSFAPSTLLLLDESSLNILLRCNTDLLLSQQSIPLSSIGRWLYCCMCDVRFQCAPSTIDELTQTYRALLRTQNGEVLIQHTLSLIVEETNFASTLLLRASQPSHTLSLDRLQHFATVSGQLNSRFHGKLLTLYCHMKEQATTRFSSPPFASTIGATQLERLILFNLTILVLFLMEVDNDQRQSNDRSQSNFQLQATSQSNDRTRFKLFVGDLFTSKSVASDIFDCNSDTIRLAFAQLQRMLTTKFNTTRYVCVLVFFFSFLRTAFLFFVDQRNLLYFDIAGLDCFNLLLYGSLSIVTRMDNWRCSFWIGFQPT
jgi:hypothetical protein